MGLSVRFYGGEETLTELAISIVCFLWKYPTLSIFSNYVEDLCALKFGTTNDFPCLTR